MSTLWLSILLKSFMLSKEKEYEVTEMNFIRFALLSGLFLCTNIYAQRQLSGSPATQNSFGMAFVYIAPGTFTMGSGQPNGSGLATSENKNRSEWAVGSETPHLVTLTRGFEIQTTETTEDQYCALMGHTYECSNWYNPQVKNLPFHDMSWHDIGAYISKLNKLENSKLDCSTFERSRNTVGCFRLPTEAEWEYAARAGSTDDFSFGNDWNLLKQYAWTYDERGGNGPFFVATKKPNAWGIYDMYGNVEEFVQDTFEYEYPSSQQTDPVNLKDQGSYAVVRGGTASSAHFQYWNLRAAARDSRSRWDSCCTLTGFRLVRTSK